MLCYVMCCTGIDSHAVKFYLCWTAGRKRVMTFPSSSPVWIVDEASESVLPGWDQCFCFLRHWSFGDWKGIQPIKTCATGSLPEQEVKAEAVMC